MDKILVDLFVAMETNLFFFEPVEHSENNLCILKRKLDLEFLSPTFNKHTLTEILLIYNIYIN